MSEFLLPNAYNYHAPSHNERASVYIGDSMTVRDREEANDIANSFFDPNKPAAKTAVLIPVAAHQDGNNILPALSEYAEQRTEEPFTVFLHLNAPYDIDNPQKVEEAEAAVEKASDLFPHLDVRSSLTFYDNPTIGRVRRDLWNAAFLLAYHEHGFSSDVIGVNNDIDAHRISPHYIARIQQHYKRKDKWRRRELGEVVASKAIQKPVATRVTHAVVPSHPNTGKVTTWIDNTYFQAHNNSAYEAGLAIPFSSYAHHGGFNEDAKTHETSFLHDGTGGYQFISGAHLYTSPRRYIDRLREHDSSEIWSDETFTATDTCREKLPSDISFDRAEELISERLYEDMTHFWLPSILQSTYEDLQIRGSAPDGFDVDDALEGSTRKIEGQVLKAERLLRKALGSTVLADMVREDFGGESFINSLAREVHYLYAASHTRNSGNGK